MVKSDSDLPRISVNKLAEFMTCRKASRQRQILRDQKYPTDYKGMYHKEASEAISLCISSNLENLSALERTIFLLEQQQTDKIGTQRRLAANIDAIESFHSMLDRIDFKGGLPSLAPISPPKLRIQNVGISVRPEIILRGRGRSGAQLVGAMKLHFPTTYPLDDSAGGYVSAVLQEWAKHHLADEGEVYGPYSIVIDVGSRAVYPGVKATATRMKDVQDTCRNIAALWPTIKPSED